VRARRGEVLAFLPVGPFPEHGKEVLDATTGFTRLWFDLDVRVLDGRPLPEKGWHRTRGDLVQYETGYFLRFLLPNEMPKDAVCLFGVTMADLYPDEAWNFVFGQASLKGRVGVWSFARFFAGFSGAPETAASRRLALRRSLRLVVHEAGHAFGLVHCIEYACVMNGSNSLDEADRQPLRLCPPCLRKLQWNRGFDVLRRYEALAAFHDAHGLEAEARWTRARIARIRASR
jgi:archaemetzincin